jgi:hypothetical protein
LAADDTPARETPVNAPDLSFFTVMVNFIAGDNFRGQGEVKPVTTSPAAIPFAANHPCLISIAYSA